jgi:hypothetical protein
MRIGCHRQETGNDATFPTVLARSSTIKSFCIIGAKGRDHAPTPPIRIRTSSRSSMAKTHHFLPPVMLVIAKAAKPPKALGAREGLTERLGWADGAAERLCAMWALTR